MSDSSRRVSTLTRHLVSSTTRSPPSSAIRIGEIEGIVWASLAGSVGGVTKINQDAVAVSRSNDGSSVSCCLCDGHGEYGELVSRLVSQSIAQGEAKNAEAETNLSQDIQALIQERIGSVSLYAGCTGVWVRKENKSLRISNVGDSRCIVIGQDWKILFETKDHKPDDPDETKRIEACGGRVVKRPGNVARVAGLALSRAFGDFAATASGVNAVPDVTLLDDIQSVSMVFIASDGVFDMLTSAQIVALLRNGLTNLNPVEVLEDLVETCQFLWSDDTDGDYCDDITCALWFM